MPDTLRLARNPVIVLTIAIGLAGCVGWYKGNAATAEELLGAAGFIPYEPLDNQEQTNLRSIPQRQLLKVHQAVKPTYVWADDGDCDCLYVGGSWEYDQLKQLTLAKHQADLAFQAAEYKENSSANRGLMRGYW